MDGKTLLKIMTGIFISLFVIALFGTISHKSYAYSNPYVIESAQLINEKGDVEGSITGIHKDEVINDFKLHNLNDSVTLKIVFKNTDNKRYIIKKISEDSISDNIEYTLSYMENEKVDENGTFEVLLAITYTKELNDINSRTVETPIKLTILCSDDKVELDDPNIVPSSIVITSRSHNLSNSFTNLESNDIRYMTLEGDAVGEKIINKDLAQNPKTFDSVHNYLLLLLISAFGSAVCLVLLTRENKKKLIAVTCIIFVISVFIPVIVNADETAFHGLVLKQPGIYDKLVVTYDIDGEEKTEVVNYNSTIEYKEPSKEGYTFDKWLLNDEPFDINTPIKEDIKLVAEFKPNTYTVVFDKNNIYATGSMSTQLLTYGKEEELFINKYVYNGYKFNGWNTKPDGTGITYNNKDDVINLLTDGSVTLYAQWKKVTTSDLITGKNINVKMKQLAGDKNPTYNTNNESIIEVKRSNNLPVEYNNANYLISTNTSDKPTYMWFNDGVINYFSEADTIYLNKDSSFLFNRLINVKHIDTSFNTERVTTMENMFYKNEKLEDLDLSNYNTTNVTNLKSMFSECYSIKELNFESFNTSKVTNYSYMFNQCYELTEIDLTHFNTSAATNLSHMFSSAEKLKKADISTFNTSKVTTMDAIFSNNFELEEVIFGNIDTSKVTNLAKMFMNAKSIKKIDLSMLNTNKVTNMSQMFDGCLSLIDLNVKFDTTNVTNMKRMFAKMSSIENLDISNFNTSKVTNMTEMFIEDSSLINLNLGRLNTSKVTEMADMFRTCSKIKHIDVSSFNTSNVVNMKGVFNGMNSLESIDVSNFDTSKATNMQGMFSGLNLVKTIDVSNFKTSKVTNMAWMFDKMYELETIYVGSKFSTQSVTKGNQMFEFDSKLVGANGTTYNKNNITHAYARLDTDEAPGYFTYK